MAIVLIAFMLIGTIRIAMEEFVVMVHTVVITTQATETVAFITNKKFEQ